MPWLDPDLTLRWPDYDKPDPEEQKFLVDLSVAAKTNQLATKRQLIEKLAPVFGTKDPSAVLKALEAEAEEAKAHEAEKAQGELDAALQQIDAKNRVKPPGSAAGGRA